MINTARGEIVRDSQGVRLVFTRRLDTDIGDAWSALTDSDRTARWFGPWSGDPSSGHIEVVMIAEGDPAPQTITIVTCEEPTDLVLDAPSPDGTWRLSVQLSQDGDGTKLVFTHRLEEPYDASSIGPGWHFYVDRLEAVIAGQPVPEDFDPYMEQTSGAYPIPG